MAERVKTLDARKFREVSDEILGLDANESMELLNMIAGWLCGESALPDELPTLRAWIASVVAEIKAKRPAKGAA